MIKLLIILIATASAAFIDAVLPDASFDDLNEGRRLEEKQKNITKEHVSNEALYHFYTSVFE